MKSTRFINALTGEVISGDILPNKRDFFFLNSEGEETTSDVTNLIYFFPNEYSPVPKTPLPEDEKMVNSFGNVSNSQTFEFFLVDLPSNNNNENLDDIKARIKKENEKSNEIIDKISAELNRIQKYSRQFHHQCNALQSLYRNTTVYEVSRFEKFVKFLIAHENEFAKWRKKITKNANQIWMELELKDLSIRNNRNKSSITDLNSIFDLIYDDVKDKRNIDDNIIINNFQNFEKYEDYCGNIQFYKKFLNFNLKVKFKGIVYEKEYCKLTMIKTPNSNLDEFLKFIRRINNRLSKLKIFVNLHTKEMNAIRNISNISFARKTLNEIRKSNNFNEILELHETINQKLFECFKYKRKMDFELGKFFKRILTTRWTINKFIKNTKKKFKTWTKKIINIDIKKIIFAQNLPLIFDDCIYELLRRSKFIRNIQPKILRFNMEIERKCVKENKTRELFVHEKSVFLTKIIPEKLVKSIHSLLTVPQLKHDYSELDKSIPNDAVLGEEIFNVNNSFETVDYDMIEMPILMDNEFRRSNENDIGKEKIFDNKNSIYQTNLMIKEHEKMNKIMNVEVKEIVNKLQINSNDIDLEREDSEIIIPYSDFMKGNNFNFKAKNSSPNLFNSLQREVKKLKERVKKLKQVNDYVKTDKENEIEKISREKEMEIKLLNEEKVNLFKEIQDLRKNNKDLTQRMRNLTSNDSKNVNEELEKAWKEVDKYKHRIDEMKNGVDTLRKLKNELELKIRKENNDLKSIVKEQTTKIKRLQTDYNELECIMNPTFLKNEELKRKVKTKTREVNDKMKVIEQYKRASVIFENEKKTLEIKNQGMRLEIHKQIQKIESYESKLMKMEKKLKKYKSKSSMENMYSNQCNKLVEMGFKSKPLNTMLLYKRKGDINHVIFDLQQPQTLMSVNNRYVAIENIVLNDRVLFYKISDVLWKIHSLKDDVKFYLHPVCIKGLKLSQKKTNVVGKIIELKKINSKNRSENLLKLKFNYTLVFITTDIEK